MGFHYRPLQISFLRQSMVFRRKFQSDFTMVLLFLFLPSYSHGKGCLQMCPFLTVRGWWSFWNEACESLETSLEWSSQYFLLTLAHTWAVTIYQYFLFLCTQLCPESRQTTLGSSVSLDVSVFPDFRMIIYLIVIKTLHEIIVQFFWMWKNWYTYIYVLSKFLTCESKHN